MPALILRHLFQDFSKELGHFRRIVHRRIARLTGREIYVDVIAGIHAHDVADP